jgi:SAM-dependent methyltransferase
LKTRHATESLAWYIEQAPLAMAIERLQECRLYAEQDIKGPILDLGCGDGLFMQALFTSPLDCGIDINAQEIERARRTGMHQKLLCCPGQRIPLPNACFRTIISNSVLEHIPDLLPVLGEARRLLTDDGCLLATVPSDWFERHSIPCRILETMGLNKVAHAYRRWYNSFWAHYHAYPPMGWQELFQKAGFEVQAVIPYGSPFLCSLCDALVPLALPSLLARRTVGRWIAIPWLRRRYAPIPRAFARLVLSGSPAKAQNGLLFFKLKPGSARDSTGSPAHDRT